MRWFTPKGTIELAPVNRKDDQAIAASNLITDALSHFNDNRFMEAMSLCQTILRHHPQDAQALHLLGLVHYRNNNYMQACDLIKRALVSNPDVSHFHNNLGEVYSAMGDLEEAVHHYRKALSLQPDFSIAHNNLANALAACGNTEAAVEHYEKATAINPSYAEAYRNLSLIKVPSPGSKKTRDMLQLIGQPDINDGDAMHLHFALGKVYEKAGSYDTAFDHYSKGNRLKRNTIEYDANTRPAFIDSLIQTYTRDYFDHHAFHGSDSDRPVFIVGMPRSGTTLVEQIVSSHPRVFGAGELIFLQNIEQLIARQIGSQQPYPACMADLAPDQAKQLAGQYLEQLNAYSTDAPYVTDKMPGNYQRIGLIKTLFPNARIIHCRRHPLDTCVSIFCNYFRGTHNYAYDLTELGLFYRQYARLMAHWKDLFGDAIFDVQYEELTRHQEPVSRALIDYLGLDWDPACLEFYNNKRPVQTASNLQVTKPMYGTSVDKWKHYEKHLGPLIESLGDVVAAGD